MEYGSLNTLQLKIVIDFQSKAVIDREGSANFFAHQFPFWNLTFIRLSYLKESESRG